MYHAHTVNDTVNTAVQVSSPDCTFCVYHMVAVSKLLELSYEFQWDLCTMWESPASYIEISWLQTVCYVQLALTYCTACSQWVDTPPPPPPPAVIRLWLAHHVNACLSSGGAQRQQWFQLRVLCACTNQLRGWGRRVGTIAPHSGGLW